MYINMRKLAEDTGKTEEQIKGMRLSDILDLVKTAEYDERAHRENDDEYRELVRNFLTCYDYLSNWWSDDEIIHACAQSCSERDIVSEVPVRHQAHAPYGQPCEFLRTSMETLPRYTKQGERLMEGEYTKCDVYRIPNHYQHTKHGPIVLSLLYDTYPQLRQFRFSAYGIDAPERYEIYPADPQNVYTPFRALMEGDVPAIIERNREYAKQWGAGSFTSDATEERLKTQRVQEYFAVIAALPRKGDKD